MDDIKDWPTRDRADLIARQFAAMGTVQPLPHPWCDAWAIGVKEADGSTRYLREHGFFE
jgi:hypothetical protein